MAALLAGGIGLALLVIVIRLYPLPSLTVAVVAGCVAVHSYPHLVEAATAVVFLVWVAWCFNSAGSTRGTATMGAAYRGRSATPLTGGPCGACGFYVEDIAAHEAGHWAAAKALGYKVKGAAVYPGDGGFTSIPGWGGHAWDTMRMAAAGAAGENRNRMFLKAEINGGKSDKWTDAWWVHRLAPQVAAERGVTVAEVIHQATREGERLVASQAGTWNQVRTELTRKRQIGDTS